MVSRFNDLEDRLFNFNGESYRVASVEFDEIIDPFKRDAVEVRRTFPGQDTCSLHLFAQVTILLKIMSIMTWLTPAFYHLKCTKFG